MFSLIVPDMIQGSSLAKATFPLISSDPEAFTISFRIPINKVVFPEPTAPITMISSAGLDLKFKFLNTQLSLMLESSLLWSSISFHEKLQFFSFKEYESFLVSDS